MWGISVGLWKKDEPIYGIAYYPRCLDRHFYTIKGSGAFNDNDKKIKLVPRSPYKSAYAIESTNNDLRLLILQHDFGEKLSYRATGSTIYDGYNLFRGAYDFSLIYQLSIWDIAAIIQIVSEIGYIIDYIESPISLEDPDVQKYRHKLFISKPDIRDQIYPQMLSILKAFEKE